MASLLLVGAAFLVGVLVGAFYMVASVMGVFDTDKE